MLNIMQMEGVDFLTIKIPKTTSTAIREKSADSATRVRPIESPRVKHVVKGWSMSQAGPAEDISISGCDV